MPLYEYRCKVCGTKLEVLQKMADAPPVCEDETCTHYHKTMDKQISASNFELKGGGWAKDGYAK